MDRLFNASNGKEFRLMVESAFIGLTKKMKSRKDQQAFNRLLEPILLEIKKYITRRLANAVRSEYIPSGKYKTEDLLSKF